MNSISLYAPSFPRRREPIRRYKGVKALLDLAAKERPDAAKAQPERFINATLLKELDDSGFIDGLYR